MTREPAWCPANPAPGSPDAGRPMRRIHGERSARAVISEEAAATD
jgi:hypothetical protein